MAEQITKKTRHLQKHDVEANWLKAINFKPMPGEIIVYDKDEQHDFVRTKIGDGETYINDLPFVNNAIIDVTSLPTEHINYEAIYRVIDTVVYDYGDPLYDPKFHYVDALPEEGEGVVDLDTDDLCFYYNGSDGLVYCYVDEALSAAAGADGMEFPIGWYPYDVLGNMMGGIGTMVLNVYSLPNQGMPAFNPDTGDMWLYYNISENEVYCYIDDNLSAMINAMAGTVMPTGWYVAAPLMGLTNTDYRGIFTKEEDIPSEGLSILIKYNLYNYDKDWKQVGGTQVQADWDQWDETQPDYIRNKPIIATPDWNVTSGPGAILNKPFGEVNVGTIMYDGPVECSSIYQGKYITSGIYNYTPPKFLEGIQYNITLNGVTFVGTVKDGKISLSDNYSYFNSNRFELLDYDLNGSYHLRIIVSKSGSYQIDSKYLPEGAKIGQWGGYSAGAEIFNDYEYNKASAYYAHAEGSHTTASGDYAHAEGYYTTASGYCAHTEGYITTASGYCAHAEGFCTHANSTYQHVEGRYNIIDTGNEYAHIVGNGTPTENSNAHTLDWDGNAWYAGSITTKGLKVERDGAAIPVAVIPETTTADNDKTLIVKNGQPTWQIVQEADLGPMVNTGIGNSFIITDQNMIGQTIRIEHAGSYNTNSQIMVGGNSIIPLGKTARTWNSSSSLASQAPYEIALNMPFPMDTYKFSGQVKDIYFPILSPFSITLYNNDELIDEYILDFSDKTASGTWTILTADIEAKGKFNRIVLDYDSSNRTTELTMASMKLTPYALLNGIQELTNRQTTIYTIPTSEILIDQVPFCGIATTDIIFTSKLKQQLPTPALEHEGYVLTGSSQEVYTPQLPSITSYNTNHLYLTSSEFLNRYLHAHTLIPNSHIYIGKHNLCPVNNITINQYTAGLKFPIICPAGTYTFSCDYAITTGEPSDYCLQLIYGISGTTYNVHLVNGTPVTFTIPEPFEKYNLYAGAGMAGAQGKIAEITNLSMVYGNIPLEYVNYKGTVYDNIDKVSALIDELPLTILASEPIYIEIHYNPSLPKPKETDNNKILTIVNGIPQWAESNNDDLEAALDAILKIQEQLIGNQKTLITFTIDGVEYQAEEGMTWREWCESEYCENKFNITAHFDGDYIASIMSETSGYGVSDMSSGMPTFGLANEIIAANSVWYLVD